MRAVIFHGPGDLRLEDVPDPRPGAGDLLVQVEVALTDGTDLKTFRRGHPLLLGDLPSPFGHEFCGIDVATGRRVVAANSDGDLNDLQLLNGAYAELLVVPERIARVNLHAVPEGLAPEVAALVEPLACCLHGVERAELGGGERVAVLGAGPIGLMMCACIRDAGASPVVVGGRAERRELVPAFGHAPRHARRAAGALRGSATRPAQSGSHSVSESANSVRSGSRRLRSSARSTSMHSIPRASASVRA